MRRLRYRARHQSRPLTRSAQLRADEVPTPGRHIAIQSHCKLSKAVRVGGVYSRRRRRRSCFIPQLVSDRIADYEMGGRFRHDRAVGKIPPRGMRRLGHVHDQNLVGSD